MISIFLILSIQNEEHGDSDGGDGDGGDGDGGDGDGELVIAVAVPRWDGIWLRILGRGVISTQVLWDILVQPGTEHL